MDLYINTRELFEKLECISWTLEERIVSNEQFELAKFNAILFVGFVLIAVTVICSNGKL